VIIVSFAGGFNILYGEVSSLWSGGNEFVASMVNAFTGLDNRVTNNVFQPYVVYWLGDITVFIYLIICIIVLVNMLIAMMGAKFTDLTEKHVLLRKQLFARGSALVELEHAILPAPLNIFHLIVLYIWKPWWPYGEFDRWMYTVLPNPFIFTGQLRDMWCKYQEWRKDPKCLDDGDEEEEESEDESDEDDAEEFFLEKDQYDVNASEDELNHYVIKLNKLKPFMDKYFARWHRRYKKALLTHRGGDDGGDDGGDGGDDASTKLKSPKKTPTKSPKSQKSPKSPKDKKKGKEKNTDLDDPDYIAMADKNA